MEIITPTSPFEEHKILNTIPRFLLELNEQFEFYIAGGMITSVFTSREINDIDIYLRKEEDLIPVIKELLDKCQILSATNKSLFLRCIDKNDIYMINLVYFDFFNEAIDIFKCFDFTCVMGAYSVREEKFYLHEDFITHNAQRRLKFNKNTNYPIMSLFRVKKYVDRGYFISKNEYLRMVLKCMTLKITSYDELEDHIGGMYGLDLNTMIDTSVEFDLENVIDQISEVIQDFDEGINTHQYNNDYYYDEIDKTILRHKLKLEKNNLTKIKIDDESFIFLENGIIKYTANFNDRIFNEITDYEYEIIKGTQLIELDKNGQLFLHEARYGNRKEISKFLDNNEEKIRIYREEKTIKRLDDSYYSNYKLVLLMGIFEAKIGNIEKDSILTTSYFSDNNYIIINNPRYKKSLPIKKENNGEIIPKLSSKELAELNEKITDRIYKLSSKYKIVKKKKLIEEQKKKTMDKEVDKVLDLKLPW